MKIITNTNGKHLKQIFFIVILAISAVVFTACPEKSDEHCHLEDYEITLVPDEISILAGASSSLTVNHSLYSRGCLSLKIIEVSLVSYGANPAGFTLEGCYDVNYYSGQLNDCQLTVLVPPGVEPGSYQIELVSTLGDGYDYITDTEVLKINITSN